MVDVIVIGSGASAVNAAWPLAEAGARVLMLDAAMRDETYEEQIPAKDFTEIRRTDPLQHRYFLGDDFEGIPFGPVRVGAQLTPPRQHVSREAAKRLPLGAKTFHAMQTLAIGGLGAAWGAACVPFTDEEMRGWPITRADLQPHYEAVARRIGVCGRDDDDLARYFGETHALLPAARIDSNAEYLKGRYETQRRELKERGFSLGEARLAAATVEHRGRGPLQYFDMEFWADKDRAVYRPRFTVEELKAFDNFAIEEGVVAERIERTDAGLEVSCVRLRDGMRARFAARRVVVAAGTLGTARLMLHSLGRYGERVPIVSNPYTYYPSLVWPMVGKRVRDRRHSLTQLMIYQRPSDDASAVLQGQIYSYRSLLLFKLVKESPLPHRESIRLMQLLQSYFIILGVHHEDRPGPEKYLELEKTGEATKLYVHYEPTREEQRRRLAREGELVGNVRKLGCLPIKRIHPGEGSSIHYGGCFPMCEAGGPLTTKVSGELRAMEGVYVADGAAFPHLPAKGLTFTLMANAVRIGAGVRKEFSPRSHGGTEKE